jgi:enoyl-CoA hydratase/carnithine racemase
VFQKHLVDFRTAFAEMRSLSDQLFASADAAEGMAAFAEKRAPVWPS